MGAQVKPKSEAKASTDDFNVFALPSRLQNAVIRVYNDAGNVIETHGKRHESKQFRHQRKAKDNVVPLRFDQVVWSFTHLVS